MTAFGQSFEVENILYPEYDSIRNTMIIPTEIMDKKALYDPRSNFDGISQENVNIFWFEPAIYNDVRSYNLVITPLQIYLIFTDPSYMPKESANLIWVI